MLPPKPLRVHHTGMKYIDVFNGDADGICALHQLRLAEPTDSQLVSGVKRDINLLKRVDANPGDRVTVLDISLDKNRDDLIRILETGASVQYFDHHYAGDIPGHENLDAVIDTENDVCTSLLVNSRLKGRYLAWAVTAAFGDNLKRAATELARQLSRDSRQIQLLEELGTLINYNGYGVSLDDLHYDPVELYSRLSAYEDPLDFIQQEDVFSRLQAGYQDDLEQAAHLNPVYQKAHCAAYLLPNEGWARRCSGIFANALFNQNNNRAYAILTMLDDSYCQISIRTPYRSEKRADEFCMQFESGGGRKRAGGINRLPISEHEQFIKSFDEYFSMN